MASTIQCSSRPTRRCQISTDSPNEAPREITTVATITAAATTERVMISMMMKISASAEIPATIRSYWEPSAMSLKVCALPGQGTVSEPLLSSVWRRRHVPSRSRSHPTDRTGAHQMTARYWLRWAMERNGFQCARCRTRHVGRFVVSDCGRLHAGT